MSDNIQVIVRCRARNEREVASKSPNIVGLPNDVCSLDEPFVSVNNEHPSIVPIAPNSNSANRLSGSSNGKVFKVDQVYGPNADQGLIFENVALPLFHEFVNGMNVTMLAYGQTGSGKTYSMCGNLEGEHAGIIPRVLTKLFSALSGDNFVKLSCVELYKEELRDLICEDQDTASRSKLRLISDSTRKAATIQNLSEIHIDSCEMGFTILKKCLSRRRTGATKLNDLSSRSHTIFTINLYKQSDPSNSLSDYCVSKMNLVDLAGSEDINKSGAMNERAREAGSINQSLLTLGKVISSLSEGKEPKHIPYRESKLTRLLQGSIGGRTKTALIATISPAKINAHETISTLNYASKAKSIKNIPQSTHDSEMVLKKVLVNELSSQIARVTRDLMATKDREGGIRMSMQNYDEYNMNMNSMESDLKEKGAEVKSLSARLEKKDKEIEELRQQLKLAQESEETIRALWDTEKTEVASLNSKISLLQEKYRQQNVQLSQVMLINLSEVDNTLANILRSISNDKGKIEGSLDSLKSDFTLQIMSVKSILKQKATEIEVLIATELAKLEKALEENLDITPYRGDLLGFNLDEEISVLQDSNKLLSQELRTSMSADSPAFKSILEKADRQYLSLASTLKTQMIDNIGKAVEDLFHRNFQIFRDSVKLTSTDVLSTGSERVLLLSTRNYEVVNTVSAELQEKSQHFKQRFSSIDKQITEGIEASRINIRENTRPKILGALSSMADTGIIEDNIKIQHMEETIDSAKRALERISQSASLNHEHTSGSFGKIRKALAEVVTSPNSTRSVPASPKRSPIRSPLTNPAKRRKPMSPLKNDNGLFRSHIPQLSHPSK